MDIAAWFVVTSRAARLWQCRILDRGNGWWHGLMWFSWFFEDFGEFFNYFLLFSFISILVLGFTSVNNGVNNGIVTPPDLIGYHSLKHIFVQDHW